MQKQLNVRPKWIGMIFVCTGLICLLIGILAWFRTNSKLERYEHTAATIVRIREHRDSEGEMQYDVYIDYTGDDAVYSDRRLGYYSSGMKRGDRIEIAYDPDDPEQIIVAGAGAHIVSYILGFIGVVHLGMGLLAVHAFREKREPELEDPGEQYLR